MLASRKVLRSPAYERASRSWEKALEECPGILQNDDPDHIELVFRIGYHSGAEEAWGRARWLPVWFVISQFALFAILKLLGAL